jgi:hypothetical protein
VRDHVGPTQQVCNQALTISWLVGSPEKPDDSLPEITQDAAFGARGSVRCESALEQGVRCYPVLVRDLYRTTICMFVRLLLYCGKEYRKEVI